MKNPAGRPIKYPGTRAKALAISFPASLIPKIDALAKLENNSRSGLVVAAINAYLGESVSSQADTSYPSNAFPL